MNQQNIQYDRIVAFDTETTGVDPLTSRIVTAFIGLYDYTREKTGESVWLKSTNYLINPLTPIPAEATAVHGITDEKAQTEGTDASKTVLDMYYTLETFTDGFTIPIAAYNAAFDLTLLHQELKRHGHTKEAEQFATNINQSVVIDPLVLDGHLDKYRKGKRTLTTTAAIYKVPVEENAHDAAADCLMTARLAAVLTRHTNLVSELTPYQGSLMRAQQDWRKDRMSSLTAWLKSEGKDTSNIDSGWPFLNKAEIGTTIAERVASYLKNSHEEYNKLDTWAGWDFATPFNALNRVLLEIVKTPTHPNHTEVVSALFEGFTKGGNDKSA